MALLTACADEGGDGDEGDAGGGDLTTEEQAYADAFAATLVDDESGFDVEPDESACMGEAVMAELGVEPFEDAGVTPEDIQPGDDASPGAVLGDGAVSQDQAAAITAAWGDDCVDLVAMLVRSAGRETELDPDGEECLTDGLGQDDLAARLLAGAFTTAEGQPDDATVEDFLALLTACGDDGSNPVVAAIAESLAEDGSLTDAQAQCLAEGVINEIGEDRMGELFASGGFDDLGAEVQEEITAALLQAAVIL